jgi:RND family efflux transporter MFP subunit
MNDQTSEQADYRVKKRIRHAIVLFIAALLGFTLYSNTLLTMNLPKVWAEEASSGQLIQNFSGSGMLQPISVVELNNNAGWVVKEVRIKVGDRVTKGQPLVTYNSREAEDRIQDDEANLARLQLVMEGLEEQCIKALHNADDEMIREAKRNLDIAQLESGVQDRKLRSMRDNLKNFRQITAPFDGVITQVSAIKGLPSGQAGADVRLSQDDLGYQFTLDIPSSITDQMEIGKKIKVDIKIKGKAQSLDGQIKRIENMRADNEEVGKQNAIKRVLIWVQSKQLEGGEQANVNLSMSSESSEGMLIPLKAIHGEGTEPFIFVIEEKTGPLGNTYLARKVAIDVGESNDVEAVALSGAYPGQFIIIESSEPLQDGIRVRLK